MIRTLLVLLAGLGVLRPTACPAQVFTRTDSLRWHVRFAATGSLSDGNAPRALFANVLDVSRLDTDFGLVLRQSYQYGTIRYRTTNNDVLSTNYLMLHPAATVVPFVRLELETNLLRRINFRYQPAAGLIYKVMATPGQAVNLFASGGYEHTRYDGTGFKYGHDDRALDNATDLLATWRAMLGLNGQNKLFGGKVALTYNAWWQQSVQDAFDYRYHADGSLSLPLTRHFSFTTSARYSFENIELVGVKPFDLQWTYGLSVANF